jgi:transcriptional regulator with XRE-family HTH domain
MSLDASLRSLRYRKLVELLHRARNDAQLTQAEVAARMQRPQQWVSQCERGRRRIDFVELEDFARVYARPVHWFLTTASDAEPRPVGG